MKKALKTALLMITLILIIASCATTEKAEKSDKSGSEISAEMQESLSNVDSIAPLIAKSIQDNETRFHNCFMKAYERGTVESKIKYYFSYTIDSDGVVDNIGQDKNYPRIDDAELDNCFVNVIKKIVYPKQKGRDLLTVNLPFVFTIEE